MLVSLFPRTEGDWYISGQVQVETSDMGQVHLLVCELSFYVFLVWSFIRHMYMDFVMIMVLVFIVCLKVNLLCHAIPFS